MKALHDTAKIFHGSDCPGVIRSDTRGGLRCTECGKVVGWMEPAVLNGLVDLLARERRSAAQVKFPRLALAEKAG